MAKRFAVELDELRNRLREAEETLGAIRNGEVDSLIVTGPHGDQVFSLKGAEQPYRIFVERMLEGAVTLTREGTILYCNRRFADMVKERMEKVIGAQLQSFIRGSDRAQLDAVFHNPAGAKVRYMLTAQDGTLIPAQLAFCRMPDSEVEAFCLVVTDLTEQEERRELASALQKLQHAQELLQSQNEELVRARAAAVAANEAKDSFIAALSHELRTPLTPVLMTAAALEADESLPPGVRAELALLRRNVDLEARLIDDLLDLTRIVRGKIDLQPDLVDVHAIFNSSLEICRPEIGEKNIHLVQSLEARRWHANADAVRLQQILWNLIRNAVKFTPNDGRITVRSEDHDGMLRIFITDTGIGIEPDAIDRIFSPFEQADRFITRRFGGLGLGLAISRRLAELHGGTITAHSEGLDRGSTFILTIPLVDRPAPAIAHRSTPTAPANGGGRRLSILLVEDHLDTRESMVRLLGRKHQVRDVQNIELALEAARAEKFDLVISDIGLPDGSGLELMRQLRQRYNLKGICLSGFGMEDDIKRSVAAGFDHHLTKPIDLRKLEAAIETLAGKGLRV
jgi:PAS domain S-box-containing protein